jgi:hypothetical protein
VNFPLARHDIGFGDEKIHGIKEIIPRPDTSGACSDQRRLEAAPICANASMRSATSLAGRCMHRGRRRNPRDVCTASNDMGRE